MTSLFDAQGRYIPVTLVELGPCPIVQVKTMERDGYRAVQIAWKGTKAKKDMSKPVAGHIAKAGLDVVTLLREFRLEEHQEDFELGKIFTVADFDELRTVDVSGTSKGRGFTGGMKRYHFRGGPASHGTEKRHRTNGSLMSGPRLTHIFKGKRMSGHMGNARATILNLVIAHIDKERNLIAIKGGIPGSAGCLVEVRQS